MWYELYNSNRGQRAPYKITHTYPCVCTLWRIQLNCEPLEKLLLASSIPSWEHIVHKSFHL